MGTEYSDDTSDFPAEAGGDEFIVSGGDEFIVCCMGCGATSPPLLTDVGLNMWVSVHPCGVPISQRTWFLTSLGEEVRD